MKEVIVYESCPEQKPLSVFPNSSPSLQNSSRKIMTKSGKNWKPEKWCSEMASILPTVDTCVKMREVIVLHPVMNKNLSRFFKIHSGFPGIALGKQVVKTGEKTVFLLFWGRRFWRGKVVFGPPWGGKWY
jgi:hypothetical protein